MRLVRSKNDDFDPFWGCTLYRADGCKGTREILEDGTPDMFEEDKRG